MKRKEMKYAGTLTDDSRILNCLLESVWVDCEYVGLSKSLTFSSVL